MGTDRVEVAEQHHVPFGVGFLHVAEDFFEHGLCLSVGVGALALGACFGNGNLRRIAVHGGGRTEDEVLAAVATHDPEQHERGVHVVFVVFEWLFDGFADGLEPCKVDAGVKLVFVKDFVQCGFVTDVCVHEGDGLTDEFCHAAEGFVAGVYQVVDNDDGMACFVEFNDGVASNITCSTHYGYFHNCS